MYSTTCTNTADFYVHDGMYIDCRKSMYTTAGLGLGFGVNIRIYC